MLALGDALAFVLSDRREFSAEDLLATTRRQPGT